MNFDRWLCISGMGSGAGFQSNQQTADNISILALLKQTVQFQNPGYWSFI